MHSRKKTSSIFNLELFKNDSFICLSKSLITPSMRIDKFLWCVRKFKTRSLASEVVKKERILLNDELVKASRSVKVGDTFSIKKDGVILSFKIIDIPKSRLGAKLVENYIEDITAADQIEKMEFIQMMKTLNRKKGTGRPTKKERRDLDKLSDEED